MASKAQNVKKALGNGRTRMIFIGGFALVGVVMLVAWMIVASKSSKAERELASAVSAPPPMQSAGGPPQEATPEYDKLLAQDNAQAADEALQSGGSAIPTPRTGVKESEIQIGPAPINGVPQGVGVAGQSQGSIAPTAPVPDEQQRQAYEQAVEQRMQAVQQQMERLQGYWSTQSHSSVRLAPEPSQVAAAGTERTTNSSSSAVQGQTSTYRPAPDIRSGDVKYATLDIGINTDDPDSASNVMATIHEAGRFNGARLFGRVELGDQYSKTVGIHFTRMSVVGEPKERTIDAWAIDPSTDRPALASEVNNHYLSRGASIFIGSFLEGYADGLLRGGQNQEVITNGTTVTVATDAFSEKQLMQIAAGNVGRRTADALSAGAQRPRTILVDARTDMGVWFIQPSATGDANTPPSILDVASPN